MMREAKQKSTRTKIVMIMSSLVVLRRARACLFFLGTLLSSSYRRWQRRRRRWTVLSFDGVQAVEVGRLIAQGGFSYVYEAFPVSDADGNDGDDRDDAQYDFGDDGHVDGTKRKYALKRINCADSPELLAACRREADAHRRLCPPSRRGHPNLMQLLGMKFVSDNGVDYSDVEGGGDATCYMLFDYLSHSLRGMIDERSILMHAFVNYTDNRNYHGRGGDRGRKPFSMREVLHLFGGILDGIIAIHRANLSHRDVKVENVMLRRNRRGHRFIDRDPEAAPVDGMGECDGGALGFTPVLVDLGSSGPLMVSIGGGRDATSSSLAPSQRRRRALMSIVEDAALHTTMAYRPPELFEGGMMTAISTATTNTEGKMDEDDILDYGKVDVWGLGCVLFGIMHGASPFEVDFSRNTNDYGGSRNGYDQKQQYGHVRIVECTRLKILGDVPLPPWTTPASSMSLVTGDCAGLSGTAINDDDANRNDFSSLQNRTKGEWEANGKYPMSMYDFVRFMVHHDRTTRPSVQEVAGRFGELHLRVFGEQWASYSNSYCDYS